jgi:hypothetical protein
MEVRDNWAVSPAYTVDKLRSGKLEDKIDVFEDQIQGWFFGPAKELTGDEQAGIAILNLVVPYFEMIACYRAGEDSRQRERDFFKDGLIEVFPQIASAASQFGENPEKVLEKMVGAIWKDLRCGLFHAATIRGRVVIEPDPVSEIGWVVDRETREILCVFIDPRRFLDATMRHFRGYLAELRDPVNTKTRERFEKLWDSRVGGPAPLSSPNKVPNRPIVLGKNTQRGA